MEKLLEIYNQVNQFGKENNFKLYFSDVGLLMKKCNYTLTNELLSNDKIYNCRRRNCRS